LTSFYAARGGAVTIYILQLQAASKQKDFQVLVPSRNHDKHQTRKFSKYVKMVCKLIPQVGISQPT